MARLLPLAALAAAPLLLLASCSSEPPTTGTDTPFAEACLQGNEGQRIAITGYVTFPDQINPDQGPVMRLRTEPGLEGESIGISTDWGQSPNKIANLENPSTYTDDDLIINLDDGATATANDRVKVSGKMYVPVVPQEFKCALENPKFERA